MSCGAVFLCGCTYNYSAKYDSNCAITKGRARDISADIFRSFGVTPEMTEHDGHLSIRMIVPYENKPGETIVPNIEIHETDQGLAVGFEDNGKGDGSLTRKIKGVIEQALARNGCSSWQYTDASSNFSFAK